MRLLPFALALLVLAGCQSEEAPPPPPPEPAAEAAPAPPPATCPDGELVVEDQVVGTGAEVTPTSVAIMDYEGTLQDGTVFDGNERFPMPMNQVIQGFVDGIAGTETIEAMKEGGSRRLTLPPNMAYGTNPPPGIPACATLTFDIVVHEVQS